MWTGEVDVGKLFQHIPGMTTSAVIAQDDTIILTHDDITQSFRLWQTQRYGDGMVVWMVWWHGVYGMLV